MRHISKRLFGRLTKLLQDSFFVDYFLFERLRHARVSREVCKKGNLHKQGDVGKMSDSGATR